MDRNQYLKYRNQGLYDYDFLYEFYKDIGGKSGKERFVEFLKAVRLVETGSDYFDFHGISDAIRAALEHFDNKFSIIKVTSVEGRLLKIC